jgi:hypothetical protein
MTVSHPTRDIRRWVHHICLELVSPQVLEKDQDLDRQENVTTLCMSLSCLKSLKLGYHPPRASLMMGLLQHSSESLTYLRMMLRPCSAEVLPFINQMKNLKELFVEAKASEGDVFPLDRPVIQPSIIRLSFFVLAYNGTATLQYLARCRVHPSCQVSLGIGPQLQEFSDYLSQFLLAHTFCKLVFNLQEQEHEKFPALGAAMSHLPHVVLKDYTPMNHINDIFTSPFALPKRLDIEITGFELELELEDEATIIYEFFDRLLDHLGGDNAPLGQSSIVRLVKSINESGGPPILWTVTKATCDRTVIFIGRMLGYALQLYSYDLYVVDQEWRDVRGVSRAPGPPCSCGLHC